MYELLDNNQLNFVHITYLISMEQWFYWEDKNRLSLTVSREVERSDLLLIILVHEPITGSAFQRIARSRSQSNVNEFQWRKRICGPLIYSSTGNGTINFNKFLGNWSEPQFDRYINARGE